MGVERAAEAHRRHAHDAYADLAGWIAERGQAGLSLRQIAAALNEEGHTTRMSKPWSHVQILNVLRRAGG